MLRNFTIEYTYSPGDLVMIDNLAVGHKAAPSAHLPVATQGLRILHRTTVKATRDLTPPHGLPQFVDIHGPNQLNEDGYWVGGGVGFRWDDSIHMQN